MYTFVNILLYNNCDFITTIDNVKRFLYYYYKEMINMAILSAASLILPIFVLLLLILSIVCMIIATVLLMKIYKKLNQYMVDKSKKAP
jgi:hypothetical protein